MGRKWRDGEGKTIAVRALSLLEFWGFMNIYKEGGENYFDLFIQYNLLPGFSRACGDYLLLNLISIFLWYSDTNHLTKNQTWRKLVRPCRELTIPLNICSSHKFYLILRNQDSWQSIWRSFFISSIVGWLSQSTSYIDALCHSSLLNINWYTDYICKF